MNLPGAILHKNLKIFGAFLLLVSLAFPMSTCTHHVDREGKRIELEEGQTLPEGARETTSYSYALRPFEPEDPYWWLDLMTFVWPVFAIALLEWRKRGPLALGTRILEPFMLAGSFWLVDFTSTFLTSGRAFGAYLAFLALSIYGLAAALADIALYREWRQQTRT